MNLMALLAKLNNPDELSALFGEAMAPLQVMAQGIASIQAELILQKQVNAELLARLADMEQAIARIETEIITDKVFDSLEEINGN